MPEAPCFNHTSLVSTSLHSWSNSNRHCPSASNHSRQSPSYSGRLSASTLANWSPLPTSFPHSLTH